LGWWLSSEEHDPRALVQHGVDAEAAGFTTAMISDHLRPWVRGQANAPHVCSVLGALSQATTELEIGTGVTAMVHRSSPINVAHAAATAATMLEGRFFLGVGTGERLNEQPFGQRWPAASERRAMLAEAIPLVRRLCNGQTVNTRGAHFAIERLALATVPAAAPPIYVASSGLRSARLAGELGDGLIGVTADAHIVETFRGTGGHGKPCLAQLHVSLASTLDEARRNAWEWWPNASVPPSVLSELATPAEFEAVADAGGPERLDGSVVMAVGAEVVVAAIDRLVAAGYDTVYLHQVGPDQRRLRDLAVAELLPHYAV
jgi:G6PDH family F420-dependent oxidoreductase